MIPLFNVPLAAIPAGRPAALVIDVLGPTISFDASLAPLALGALLWTALFLALRSIRERRQALLKAAAGQPGTTEIPAAA